MYDVTRGLRKNGFFLLNTIFDGEELVNFIPELYQKINATTRTIRNFLVDFQKTR